MTCQEFAEVVSDHLDGALPASDRARSDAHLSTCAGCRSHLVQMGLTVRSLAALRDGEADSGESEKAKLVAMFRSRSSHTSGPRERTIPLGLADALSAPGDHIGYVGDDDQDLDETTGFLAEGFERDEVCLLLAHEAAIAQVVAGLDRRGFPLDELRRRDRLHIVSGRQPVNALGDEIGQRVRAAVDAGIPMVRILGHLGWGHPGWPAERDILSLEAGLTDAVRNLPTVVLCAYDLRALSTRQLMLGGLECHPLTLRRGALRENPHRVPPREFLENLARDRASCGRGTPRSSR
jgi:hypothetical protein